MVGDMEMLITKQAPSTVAQNRHAKKKRWTIRLFILIKEQEIPYGNVTDFAQKRQEGNRGNSRATSGKLCFLLEMLKR